MSVPNHCNVWKRKNYFYKFLHVCIINQSCRIRTSKLWQNVTFLGGLSFYIYSTITEFHNCFQSHSNKSTQTLMTVPTKRVTLAWWNWKRHDHHVWWKRCESILCSIQSESKMRNMSYRKKDCERQSKKSREFDTQLWKGCCREGEAGLESGRWRGDWVGDIRGLNSPVWRRHRSSSLVRLSRFFSLLSFSTYTCRLAFSSESCLVE